MIHVLDALSVLPGQLAEVRRRVREDYQQVVAGFGQELEYTWLAPAVERIDRPTELLLLWRVPDVAGYWRMRLQASRSAEVATFWEGIQPLLAGRTRRLMCDPDDETILR